jgi:hypothetical protein
MVADNHMEIDMTNEAQKVTFRNNGKNHRGVLISGSLFATCRCPGSQNGRLTNGAKIVCEGHEQANCGK